jgi:cysteine desulfurase/selenocysteine lyase
VTSSVYTARYSAGKDTVGYDVEAVRRDFPILSRTVHDGRPLVYLDSAASAQRPRQVIEAVREYDELHHANVHRGVHALAEEATALFEGSRDLVAGFLGAAREEIVFTKNSTEAINLVAYAFGPHGDDERFRLGPGDEVVISEMEHHSNIVPWQLLCRRTGATLRWFGITDDGRLDLAGIDDLITGRTKIVSVVHQSNILGTVNPVGTIIDRAHRAGALVLLDGSQSVPHLPVSVTDLGADFVAFTGHKMLAPTGIGGLWARRELLEVMPPFLGGGEMIETVTMEGSTFAPVPHRFEAGTPPIAQAVGLGAAVTYLAGLGMTAVHAHEQALTRYALTALATVDGLRVIGPSEPVDRGAAISFTLDGIHPHDVGQLLDLDGIAVRVGHHCARPTCRRFGVSATSRASFALYTTSGEIDALVDGLERVKKVFA